MSIFKRKKQEAPQSGPKVFTPEDYSRLMTEQPAADGTPQPQATPAPAAEEPASPSFDSISPSAMTEGEPTAPSPDSVPEPVVETPTVPGSSLTEEHPEKILAVSPTHNSGKPSPEAVAALSSEVEATKPRRTSPYDDDNTETTAPPAESATPADAPEANMDAEPPAMPRMEEGASAEPADQEDEFQGNPVPPLDQPQPQPEPEPEAATEPEPVVEAAPEPQAEAAPEPEAIPQPEATPVPPPTPAEPLPAPAAPAAQPMNPSEVQDLAKRVSQALVDLEELRQQKEELEQSIQELQAKHTELETKIEQQRRIATELLEQVHRAV